MTGIVIFSPNRFSLYTCTVSELLIQRGQKVSAIFVRRLFNPSRLGSEYQRDGKRLLTKIWKKLFLRQAAYTGRAENIVSFREKIGISASNVQQLNKVYSIPVFSCSDLNDDLVLNGLEKFSPDLVVFTGGGLIRQPVLDLAGQGVINCHMGVLPEFRGMDVVEWPLLLDRPDQVGISVHFMDKGLDTGDILAVQRIIPKPGESVTNLRERMEPIMCQFLVDTCCDFLDGKVARKPQLLKEGRQYFKMHPLLNEFTQAKLGQTG